MDIRLIIFISLAATALASKLFFYRAYKFTKPLPILFIIALAFLKEGKVDAIWFLAITAGLLGDILLLGEGKFVLGLLAFLVGHIAYIFAFNTQIRAPLVLAVGAPAAGIYWYLARHLIGSRQKMYLVPVFCYVAVTAVLLMSSLSGAKIALGAYGALSFALSDFLLAFDKFVRQNMYADAGVSITYYAAQWLLALHFLAI